MPSVCTYGTLTQLFVHISYQTKQDSTFSIVRAIVSVHVALAVGLSKVEAASNKLQLVSKIGYFLQDR